MLNYKNEERIYIKGKAYTQVTATCPYCEKEFKALKGNIVSRQKSCGCMKGNKKHGMTRTRPYRAWRNMLNRCFDEKNKHYKDYGGRGITVCDKWLEFSGFWSDMKNTYKEDLTLDRINNDGNYCGDNCRWATQKEQAANKRNSITYKGETAHAAGLRINGNPSIVYLRLMAGWSKRDAFTKPSLRQKTCT